MNFLSTFGLQLTLSLGLVFVITTSTTPAEAQRMLLDKVVAVVNDDVVLLSELEIRMAEIQQNAALANMPLPEEKEFRKEVLDALVLENLQLQIAARASIRFDDDTINRILSSMAENNGLGFDEYIQALNDAGIYLETREQVRKQMTLQELQRGMVNRRIQITEQEIDNFLNSETGKEVMAPEYLVEHMLIPTGSEEPVEITQSKLEYAADLVANAQNENNFNDVRAAAMQSAMHEVNSTEFGWRKAEQLPALFREVVESMNIGDVEGPIKAGNGFHIIQLANQAGGTEQIVKQTNLRHIMLTPNEIRNEQQTEEKIHELRQRIIDGEGFAPLARQNSDDDATVVAGGDMDWANEGSLPPDMEAIINALDINELSEPFRSNTGWHIIEVLERRESDLSTLYTRNQAANALRNRKFDIELENWLIEIREKAFVNFIN
jgi:peptidyl-prolyl cis-trans isomerase SurA